MNVKKTRVIEYDLDIEVSIDIDNDAIGNLFPFLVSKEGQG